MKNNLFSKSKNSVLVNVLQRKWREMGQEKDVGNNQAMKVTRQNKLQHENRDELYEWTDEKKKQIEWVR